MGSDSTIQSVVTSLRVLQAFTPAERVLGVSELARRLDIGKSTVHRALQTLASEGFVTQTTGGRYRLGIKLWELGHQVVAGLDLRDVARPHLEALHTRSGEAAELTVLEAGDALVALRIDAHLDGARPAGRWHRVPAHCSAGGKAIMAFADVALGGGPGRPNVPLRRATGRSITSADLLERVLAQVRRDGVAVSAEEAEVGVNAVGAPVFDHRGTVVAALSVGGATARLTRERMRELAPWVRRAAEQVSSDLGHRPFAVARPPVEGAGTPAVAARAMGAAALSR